MRLDSTQRARAEVASVCAAAVGENPEADFDDIVDVVLSVLPEHVLYRVPNVEAVIVAEIEALL